MFLYAAGLHVISNYVLDCSQSAEKYFLNLFKKELKFPAAVIMNFKDLVMWEKCLKRNILGICQRVNSHISQWLCNIHSKRVVNHKSDPSSFLSKPNFFLGTTNRPSYHS